MDDDDLQEFFAALGPVQVRRMFGGKGIYHRGLIIAIVLRGELLVKGDAITAPALEAAGAKRWVYAGRSDKPVAMPYWSMPASAFDDADQMARWTRSAFEAAQRTSSSKRRARDADAADLSTRPEDQ